jgi:hypothetical protein
MSVDAAVMLAHARALLHRGETATAGLWPRAAALLARQALEATLTDLWRHRAPGLEGCPMRAQLLCVEACLPHAADLGARARYAWSGLSRACHQHPYELPPTTTELSGWLSDVEAVRAGIAAALGVDGRPAAPSRHLPAG